MEEIPAAFEREYDMVKGQIQRLTDELAAVQKRIRIEESKLKQLREGNTANPSRYTLDGISRFLGKIEYASETIASLESDGELSAEITTLRERIAKLKKIVDESVIKMKIENAITKISVKQMELLKLMDAERPDDPFRLYNLNYGSSYAIHANEEKIQGDTQDDTQGDTQDDTEEKIIKMIKDNPQVSTADMAKELKIGIATVKRKIKKMSNVSYVGSGYSGHWEING